MVRAFAGFADGVGGGCGGRQVQAMEKGAVLVGGFLGCGGQGGCHVVNGVPQGQQVSGVGGAGAGYPFGDPPGGVVSRMWELVTAGSQLLPAVSC